MSTPLAQHFKLSLQQCPSSEKEYQEMLKISYASAVGCLMYVIVCTGSDLSQAISVVSKYMANPIKKHWDAIKWILRYLKGTLDVGLLFQKNTDMNVLVGFINSDYASDLDKRISTSGYIFTLGGGLINWKAMLQDIVALSTTEVEYIAAEPYTTFITLDSV